MNNEQLARAWEMLEQINTEGFGQYRPSADNPKILRLQQEKAIRQILYSVFAQNSKYIVLTAPTGSGKSVIAAVVAKIMHELNGYQTNLTTSSRALQVQYGEDLVHDPVFKVVMGTANYSCSFFRDASTGKLLPVVEAPCHDQDRFVEDIWPTLDEGAREGEIKTVHRDQDYETLESYSDVDPEDEIMVEGKSEKAPATHLKKTCQRQGACSFYRARAVANEAPVAIRSTQHLLFYIMYQVQMQGEPVLQQRDVHIHDECHNLESVFRDFFSANFTDLYYASVIAKIDEKRRAREPWAKPLRFSSDFKEYKQEKKRRDWTNDEKIKLVEIVRDELATVIESVILPMENLERDYNDKLENANDFLRAALSGNLFIDPEGLPDSEKKVMGWYKNIMHVLDDLAKERRAKKSGWRYERQFNISARTESSGPGRPLATTLSISPLSLAGMVDRYFGGQVTLFMSATPQPKAIFEPMFGIKGKVTYIEIDSDFPPERSPIFFDPVESFTHARAMELGSVLVRGEEFSSSYQKDAAALEAGWGQLHATLAGRIRDILDHFPDLPGIIPCTSYAMVKALQTDLADIPGMIFAVGGMENRRAVTEFKRMAQKGERVILVSAGITEGHSFNDDVSRLQIIPKMPFPAQDDLMSALIGRWKGDYYPSRTATALQQMVGRSMRSKRDWCISILLDKKHAVVRSEGARKFYSQHFLKCLRSESWRDYVIPED